MSIHGFWDFFQEDYLASINCITVDYERSLVFVWLAIWVQSFSCNINLKKFKFLPLLPIGIDIFGVHLQHFFQNKLINGTIAIVLLRWGSIFLRYLLLYLSSLNLAVTLLLTTMTSLFCLLHHLPSACHTSPPFHSISVLPPSKSVFHPDTLTDTDHVRSVPFAVDIKFHSPGSLSDGRKEF